MRTRIGLIAVLLGAVVYAAGWVYGSRFAYRPGDEPAWLGPLFTAAVGVVAFGLALVAVGFVVGRRRG